MMKIIMIAITVFFCASGYAEMMNGKNLFKNAKCSECHNAEDFKDKTISKAKTFTHMKGKVSACQIQNDAMWSDDEEEVVAEYLNQKYYHFKEKK